MLFKNIGWSIWLLALAGVLVLINPYAPEVNTLEARLEYTKQLLLQITGLSSDWDVARLNEIYARSAEAERKLATSKIKDPDTMPFQLSPLPEVDTRNDENWREKFDELFKKQNIPVVARGLLYTDTETFPHARSWGINHLLTKVFQNTSVPVFTSTTNDKSAVMEPFASYVENLKNKSHIRYARCLDDRNRVMESEFSITRLNTLMGKTYQQRFTEIINGESGHCLFVGSTQVYTRLHSDIGSSAFMMMEGRKRWVLFPPSQSMYFLPVGHLFNVAYNSRIDIFSPTILEEYPFASLIKGWEVIIEPGDVLFFPSFTWHGVQNLDDITVGMDLAVYDIPYCFKRNPLLFLATGFNMKVWSRVLAGMLKGTEGSMKRVFFEGYMKDEEDLSKKE